MMGKLPYTALRDAVFTHPRSRKALVRFSAECPSARKQASMPGRVFSSGCVHQQITANGLGSL
jgi:hypothetical protein